MECGSSPLTRGKPAVPSAVDNQRRLIPAHAGKTSIRSRRSMTPEAHPRSRGENRCVSHGQNVSRGSSPLTRGKPTGVECGGDTGRLIPAHAGKTATRPPPPSSPTAHPRSRGENDRTWPCESRVAGSSPLTRGKHFLTCVFIAQIGQILESLELCASSESYSSQDAYATDAPQDQVRSIGLVPRSSRDAS